MKHANSKEILEHFLNKRINIELASAIFDQITSQYTSGEFRDLRSKIDRDSNQIWLGIEKLKEKAIKEGEFSASIIPTIITAERARNFLFSNEKSPTESEIYYWLYLTLSGLYSGPIIVNLSNVNEKTRDVFMKDILNQQIIVKTNKAINWKKLVKVCGPMPFAEYTFAFVFLNYFVYWCREKSREKLEGEKYLEQLGKRGAREIIQDILPDIGITNETCLYICQVKGKRTMDFIPKVKEFISRWYSDFFSNPNLKFPPIGRFLSSLYVIGSKESAETMNKFLYHFLRGEVNGELLEKLVILKADNILKNEKHWGIFEASNFFSKLDS